MIPTSNHNHILIVGFDVPVVYLLIPTSNHNSHLSTDPLLTLYIFWFLHQTTTLHIMIKSILLLYIFWFLHQTTTKAITGIMVCRLYIFWFLHQTTTFAKSTLHFTCCISFDSYIKPQHGSCLVCFACGCISFDSYIKPQQKLLGILLCQSCISFDSYIKPQLLLYCIIILLVVYLLIPTSNHNDGSERTDPILVVYLLIPTSNHNLVRSARPSHMLYIFWFLHQTTTRRKSRVILVSCISFDSYIKPQLPRNRLAVWCVVYLLIPTSNHNV